MYISYNGGYAQMNRVSDNYFMLQADYGIAFSLPTTLLITSILGDQVQDTLATSTPSVCPSISSLPDTDHDQGLVKVMHA